MLQIKNGFNWPCSFQEVLKMLTGDERRTTTDEDFFHWVTLVNQDTLTYIE